MESLWDIRFFIWKKIHSVEILYLRTTISKVIQMKLKCHGLLKKEVKKVAEESIPSHEQRRNQESSDNEVNDVKASTKDIAKAQEYSGILIVRTLSKPKKILEC